MTRPPDVLLEQRMEFLHPTFRVTQQRTPTSGSLGPPLGGDLAAPVPGQLRRNVSVHVALPTWPR